MKDYKQIILEEIKEELKAKWPGIVLESGDQDKYQITLILWKQSPYQYKPYTYADITIVEDIFLEVEDGPKAQYELSDPQGIDRLFSHIELLITAKTRIWSKGEKIETQ